MQMFKIENSSQIDQVGFEDGLLRVVFLKGAAYVYRNVTLKLFGGLLAADSAGSYLNKEIKAKPNEFPYLKLEAGEVAQTQVAA